MKDKKKVKSTLKAIKKFTKRHGYPPTILELAEELGISKTASHNRLDRLEEFGYVSRSHMLSRSTTITKKGYELIN